MRVERLRGGVSAEVHALTLALPGGNERRVVVRQRGATAWREADVEVLVREHAVLEALHARGMAVPEPILVDVSGVVLPAPTLVMAFVAGTTEVAPTAAVLDAMADWLAALHAVDVGALAGCLPTRGDPVPEVFDYLPEDAAGLRAALERRPAVREAVLLHGDFWSGNILWQGDRIAAVIDWEDAAIGDPLCDLAGARLELTWKHGPAPVEPFTQRYLATSGRSRAGLARWEVYVAAAGLAFMEHWGLPPADLERLRTRGEAFLARAASELVG